MHPKVKNKGSSEADPQNHHPIFSSKQLPIAAKATCLDDETSNQVLDLTTLHQKIKSATLSRLEYAKLMDPLSSPTDQRWSTNAEGLLCWESHILVPKANELRLHVLRARHNHVLAGHFGQTRTFQSVHKDYFWLKLKEFIMDYVRSCNTCMRNKARRHWPYGLLKQLPIPPQPWDSISMDFIEQLPQSNSHTEILVIVDRLTKQVIFIPTHQSIDALELANLFIQHVFSKHGVPSHVTSDRGSEFVSRFF